MDGSHVRRETSCNSYNRCKEKGVKEVITSRQKEFVATLSMQSWYYTSSCLDLNYIELGSTTNGGSISKGHL